MSSAGFSRLPLTCASYCSAAENYFPRDVFFAFFFVFELSAADPPAAAARAFCFFVATFPSRQSLSHLR